MNFLNPFFLMGLLAVAVPVIIHLINLRKPVKLPFSSLSFLQELQKSTIRRIRIKQYLLMILRALAVLCLALALARPYLPSSLGGSGGTGEAKTVGILIDNSPSMNRIGSGGPLIDQAREVARTIITNSLQGDRFVVETTNGEIVGLAPDVSARALQTVENVKAAQTGNYTAEAFRSLYDRLRQYGDGGRRAVIYMITDGQRSQVSDFESLQDHNAGGKVPVSLQLIELEEVSQQNIAIENITLESRMLSRGTPVTLSVELRNAGEVPADNQYVSLEVEGSMAGQYRLSLDPGQKQIVSFEVLPDRAGDLRGKVVLEGDEVTYDNGRYFVLHIPESRSVLLITGDGRTAGDFKSYMRPALEAARETNTQIHFTEKSVKEVEAAGFSRHDIIVLDGLKEIPEYWYDELLRFVQNGRGVLFFPSEQGDLANYNAFMGQFNAGRFTNIRGEYASFRPAGKMGRLIEGHPVLEDLFDKERDDERIDLKLPELFYYYVYTPSGNTGSYRILQSSTDEPLLTEQRFGEGKLLVSSIGTDPGWSNFPVNPLFAPLYYRAVLYASESEEGGLQEHVLGNPIEWEGSLRSRDVELVMDGKAARPEVQGLPEGVRLQYEGREWEPGILEIKAGEKKRMVAVNQDIMESHFNTLTDKELEKMLSNYVTVHNRIEAGSVSPRQLQEQLEAAGTGEEIWNWFIWLALILLGAETVLSKMYRAENIS